MVRAPSPVASPKLAASYKAEFNPAEKDAVWEKSPCISFTEEEREESEPEIPPQGERQTKDRLKWRRAALAIAITSLITSVVFSGVSFYASTEFYSSSVLTSALDTLLAVFSAAVVIWRFRDNTNGKLGPKREKCGSIAFGIAFIVNGLISVTVALVHLFNKSKPSHTGVMWPSLLTFSLVYFIIAILEFWISKKLQSAVLIALCIDDGVTAALMLALSMGSLLLNQYPFLWYLDHSVALGASLILFLCGMKILVEIFVYKQLPFQIFS